MPSFWCAVGSRSRGQELLAPSHSSVSENDAVSFDRQSCNPPLLCCFANIAQATHKDPQSACCTCFVFARQSFCLLNASNVLWLLLQTEPSRSPVCRSRWLLGNYPKLLMAVLVKIEAMPRPSQTFSSTTQRSASQATLSWGLSHAPVLAKILALLYY